MDQVLAIKQIQDKISEALDGKRFDPDSDTASFAGNIG